MKKMTNQETFICLDCESTGLNPETDNIIEIAVCKFTFKEILESFETLIDPQREIPPDSIKIHHIQPQMVEGKPFIQEILPEILKMIQGHIIVGHGIAFDLALIENEAKRHNIPTPILPYKTIDTLRLARLYGKCPINSLECLRTHFNVPEYGAHRAMSDVLVNIDVFKFLSAPYKTVDSLFEILKNPIQLAAMPLGKHKGRPFKEIPLDYLKWARHQKFDQDLLFSINSELKNRKRKKAFSESSNPFQNLE